MISIAIDGPAGAGKTTIAKRIAKSGLCGYGCILPYCNGGNPKEWLEAG